MDDLTRLTVGRRVGESILVGDVLYTVVHMNLPKTRITISAQTTKHDAKYTALYTGVVAEQAEGIALSFRHKPANNAIALTIRAPRTTQILRAELIDDDQLRSRFGVSARAHAQAATRAKREEAPQAPNQAPTPQPATGDQPAAHRQEP